MGREEEDVKSKEKSQSGKGQKKQMKENPKSHGNMCIPLTQISLLPTDNLSAKAAN